MTQKTKLPDYSPLFKPRWSGDVGGYTKEQLQAYGAACAAHAMQSQAERIKELEAEIITRTSYGDEQTDFAIKLAAERDALRTQLAHEVLKRYDTAPNEVLFDVVMAALTAGRAALANAEQAGWQPIETASPNPYEEVMVWPYPSHNCITAQRNTIGAWTYSEYETGFGWTDHVCQPTHWMPLPPRPPKDTL